MRDQYYGTMAYPSFWKTVIESPQWKAWEVEQAKRFTRACAAKDFKGIYDMAECVECGWISPAHFQDFLDFVRQA